MIKAAFVIDKHRQTTETGNTKWRRKIRRWIWDKQKEVVIEWLLENFYHKIASLRASPLWCEKSGRQENVISAKSLNEAIFLFNNFTVGRVCSDFCEAKTKTSTKAKRKPTTGCSIDFQAWEHHCSGLVEMCASESRENFPMCNFLPSHHQHQCLPEFSCFFSAAYVILVVFWINEASAF